MTTPPRVGNVLARLRARLREERAGLWVPGAYDESSGWGRVWLLVRRSIDIVVSTLFRADVQQRASSLTMVTLLSLVPLLAVGFSILTAFTSMEKIAGQIRSFILSTLAMSPDGVIHQHLDEFVSNTNTGALGTIGVLFLFFTVLSLLYSIEAAFNEVWGVKRGRTLLARFQVYWPLITLGPLLAAASVSATLAVAKRYPALENLLAFTPFLAAVMFFSLLYKILPNAKVRAGPALLGGFITGILWVLANQLFPLYARNAITYSAIYGSLAAIPLFIVSVQLSWLITLFGCNLVFAFQTARSGERPTNEDPHLSVRDRERLAVLLAERVARSYDRGDGPTTVSDLVEGVGWPASAVRATLRDLVQAGILVEVDLSDDDDPAFVPRHPARASSLAGVVDAIRGEPTFVERARCLGTEDRETLDRHRAADQAFLERLDAT